MTCGRHTEFVSWFTLGQGTSRFASIISMNIVSQTHSPVTRAGYHLGVVDSKCIDEETYPDRPVGDSPDVSPGSGRNSVWTLSLRHGGGVINEGTGPTERGLGEPRYR